MSGTAGLRDERESERSIVGWLLGYERERASVRGAHLFSSDSSPSRSHCLFHKDGGGGGSGLVGSPPLFGLSGSDRPNDRRRDTMAAGRKKEKEAERCLSLSLSLSSRASPETESRRGKGRQTLRSLRIEDQRRRCRRAERSLASSNGSTVTITSRVRFDLTKREFVLSLLNKRGMNMRTARSKIGFDVR